MQRFAHNPENDAKTGLRNERGAILAPMKIRAALRLALVFSWVWVSPAAQQNSPTQNGMHAQRLWAADETDVSGAVSRNGRFLTYVDWSTGNLAVRDLSSGTSRPLATSAIFASSRYVGTGVLSPDGRRVAYDLLTPNGVELHLLHLDANTSEVIDPGTHSWSRLQGWTEDGRHLLVVRGVGIHSDGELGLLRLSNGEFRPLAKAGRLIRADLSPDGSRIVVSELAQEDPTRSNIRLIDTRDGRSQPLITGADDYSPRWTRDGHGVVFLTNRDYKPLLSYVTVDSDSGWGTPRVLADGQDALCSVLGIATDGTIYLGADDVGGTQGYVARVDWSTGRVRDVEEIVTPPFIGARRGVFSPGGERIAYFRKLRGDLVRPGWQTPMVKSLQDGTERAYPTQLTLRDEPLWSADGKALLFAMPPAGAVGESAALVWRFVRLDFENGRYGELGVAAGPGLVRLSGNVGSTLFYVLNGYGVKNAGRLLALNLNQWATRELHRLEGTTYNDAAVTPDGKRVAFALSQTTEGSGLSLLEDDGTARSIGSVRPNARAQLAWLPGGDAIVVSGRIKNEQGVWRVPVNGRDPTKLVFDAGNVTEVRLSPNGERIAFTRRVNKPDEVWAYRGYLPGSNLP